MVKPMASFLYRFHIKRDLTDAWGLGVLKSGFPFCVHSPVIATCFYHLPKYELNFEKVLKTLFIYNQLGEFSFTN